MISDPPLSSVEMDTIMEDSDGPRSPKSRLLADPDEVQAGSSEQGSRRKVETVQGAKQAEDRTEEDLEKRRQKTEAVKRARQAEGENDKDESAMSMHSRRLQLLTHRVATLRNISAAVSGQKPLDGDLVEVLKMRKQNSCVAQPFSHAYPLPCFSVPMPPSETASQLSESHSRNAMHPLTCSAPRYINIGELVHDLKIQVLCDCALFATALAACKRDYRWSSNYR